MKLEFQDNELEALVNHNYIGKYKSYRSNTKLVHDLDKVIRFLAQAKDIVTVGAINSLGYHPLTNSQYSSVRVGYKTKYRLIFEEHDDRI